MADTLVTHLARALHLPPDAAQQTLHHLVSTLREQIEATGEATVPGLGVFRRTGARLDFEPEDALVRAVNHRYAGLAPVGAAPTSSRPAPATNVDLSPAGFHPLPSFVKEDPAEENPAEEDPPGDPAPTGDKEDLAETTDPVPTPEPEAPEEPALSAPPEQPDESVLDETPPLESVVVPEPPPSLDPEEELVPDPEPTAEPEEAASLEEDHTLDLADDSPDAEEHASIIEEKAEEVQEDEPDEVAAFDDLSDLESEKGSEDEDLEDDESSLDEILAGTWTEGVDTSEDEAHPLGSVPEEPVEEAEYAVVEPEDDVEPGHEEAEADPVVVAVSSSAVDDLEPESVEEPAPAVAAMSAAASDPEATETQTERPSRGPLVAGLVVGTLLALAFLLWVQNREPAPPPLAERPPVADTVAATSPPADTSVAELPVDPVSEPPSADPLRSSGEIDSTEGGFTWVVGSELNQAAAERRVERYREQGFRAGVVSQEAAGRTRYRVSLGQFDSIAEAEARRSDLPADVPSDSWILRL